jgi:3-hydroxyacyl-CoA dehydrogenase
MGIERCGNDTEWPAIKTIAVVGCGVIGSGWATYYLAKGFDVIATDPAAGAETSLRRTVAEYWPAVERIGLNHGASPERLTFETNAAKAAERADFIQENGPERIEIKRRLIAELDAAAPTHALIASSSSGILISDFQEAALHPERVLLGHPFNPPHLIPLVEVVGGKLTSMEAIRRALEFYTAIGKKPIYIRREMKGHVANRLQAALWREAFYLVNQGVVSVSEIDTAIANGPGLRWALLGPFLNLHLSGGNGGIRHMLEHLGPPIESWWRDLGDISITPEVVEELADGVDAELEPFDFLRTIEQRDDLLLRLLELKRERDQLP